MTSPGDASKVSVGYAKLLLVANGHFSLVSV
jgi:hypothetical protein